MRALHRKGRPRVEPEVEVQEVFRHHYYYTPTHVVSAPGHLEILGNQADLHSGLMLSAAVNLRVYIAISHRADGRISLVADKETPPHEFWVSNLDPVPEAPWADPVKATLRGLRAKGVPFTGFNASLFSTIPKGSGLNRTAALMVAMALAIRRLHPYRITATGLLRPPHRDRRGRLPKLSLQERQDLALLCHQEDREWLGNARGPQAFLAALQGRQYHLLSVDHLYQRVSPLPLHGDIVPVLLPTGLQDPRVAAEQRLRLALCYSVARKLGARSLRSVEPVHLKAERSRLTRREYECAYHIVGENQRVAFAERSVDGGDFEQLGQFLYQSHESSREMFRNSRAELDLLVELARAHPACLGARLCGLGFGGGTVNLVRWFQVEDFMDSVARLYTRLTRRPIDPLLCLPSDGSGG